LNTIGNVPIIWYKDFPHIGYDVEGNRLLKPLEPDELDKLLDQFEKNVSQSSLYDATEGKSVTLTEEEIETIQRIQRAYYPEKNFDAYPELTDYYTCNKEVMPISSAPEPKRRFVPSKWEANKVMKLVGAIRRGHLKFKEEAVKPRWYNIWGESDPTEVKRKSSYISAPKIKLPGHAASYNPPKEYLWTQEEIKKWEQTDPENRPTKFIPQKYASLRQVSAYKNYIEDRFERCLDLYLCPRVKKERAYVDPESLLPKLPLPKDLQPFPTQEVIVYKGHSDKVRNISVDPTGQWLVSGSDDRTLRLWELSTGRCLRVWSFPAKIESVEWNPNVSINLIGVAYDNMAVLIHPMVTSKEAMNTTETTVLSGKERSIEEPSLITWQFFTENDNIEKGILVQIQHERSISRIKWHRKGDYFTTVCSEGKKHDVVKESSVLSHFISSRYFLLCRWN
jgi:ribosome biogenesis protein ERB1